jgi:hypothetical protein
MTVSEWNEMRELELRIREGEALRDLSILDEFPSLTRFLCNSCRAPVHAQAHVDASGKYWKRQVICSRKQCNSVDYLIL